MLEELRENLRDPSFLRAYLYERLRDGVAFSQRFQEETQEYYRAHQNEEITDYENYEKRWRLRVDADKRRFQSADEFQKYWDIKWTKFRDESDQKFRRMHAELLLDHLDNSTFSSKLVYDAILNRVFPLSMMVIVTGSSDLIEAEPVLNRALDSTEVILREGGSDKFGGESATAESIVKDEYAYLNNGHLTSEWYESYLNAEELISRLDVFSFFDDLANHAVPLNVDTCYSYLETLERDSFQIINTIGRFDEFVDCLGNGLRRELHSEHSVRLVSMETDECLVILHCHLDDNRAHGKPVIESSSAVSSDSRGNPESASSNPQQVTLKRPLVLRADNHRYKTIADAALITHDNARIFGPGYRYVDGQQCRISYDDLTGSWMIEGLTGVVNNTRLNGKSVTGTTSKLAHGDEISVAELKLKVEIP